MPVDNSTAGYVGITEEQEIVCAGTSPDALRDMADVAEVLPATASLIEAIQAGDVSWEGRMIEGAMVACLEDE